jgi:hypothetical protein
MKYKVLRGFCLGGGKDVYPGETIDISDKDAAEPLASRKIAPLEEKAAKTEAKKHKEADDK